MNAPPSIHQDTWRRRISEYHDNLLSPVERLTVEAHLRTCDICHRLLHSYDHLYRGLRAIPGFEGTIRSAPPAVARRMRRHVAIPWAGNGTSSWGGIAAVALILIMALTVVAGHDIIFSGPSGDLSGGPSDNQATPTFGPYTSDGATVCANIATLDSHPYIFAGDNGRFFVVNDCNEATRSVALPYASYRVLSFAPGSQVFLAIGAATGPGLLAIADLRLGNVIPVDTLFPPGTSSGLADEAVWIDAGRIVALSQGMLSLIDIQKKTLTPLAPHQVGHIQEAGGAFFYSAVANGHATVHQFDVDTGMDTPVFNLGVGGANCSSTGSACAVWTAGWNISDDGSHIAYQAPLPTAVPVPNAAPIPAMLTYQPLNQAGTPLPVPLFSLPLSARMPLIRFSPDGTRIAAQLQGGTDLTIYALIRMMSVTIPANATFVWRNDGLGILTEPLVSHRTPPAQIYLIVTHQTYPFASLTSNYLWIAHP